jgi:hypothetical protein
MLLCLSNEALRHDDVGWSGDIVPCVLDLGTSRTIGLTCNYFVCVNRSHTGVRGSLVVDALCYKPEGRGFDTR